MNQKRRDRPSIKYLVVQPGSNRTTRALAACGERQAASGNQDLGLSSPLLRLEQVKCRLDKKAAVCLNYKQSMMIYTISDLKIEYEGSFT